MEPTLRSDDLLMIKDLDPAEIEEGDIITVSYDDSSIIHRWVEKIEGDGDEEPDPGIFEESMYREGGLGLTLKPSLHCPWIHLGHGDSLRPHSPSVASG